MTERSTHASLVVRLASLLVGALPAFALTVPNGAGIVLAASILLWIGGFKTLLPIVASNWGVCKRLAMTYLSFFLLCLVSLLMFHLPPSALDNPFRLALCLVVLPLGFCVPLASRMFWFGLFVGLLGVGGLAVYQKLVLGMSRVTGFTQILMFGDISMTFALMALASLGLFWRHNVLRWLPMTAFVAGLVAMMLSGSRGALLPILLCLPFFTGLLGRVGKKQFILIFLLCMMTGAVLYAIPMTGMQTRVVDFHEDLDQLSVGNANTSVGGRIALWQAALRLSWEYPLTGVGKLNFHHGLQELVEAHQADPFVLQYNHAHNDFLDIAATLGWPGVIVFALVYWVPFRFFFQRLHSPISAQADYARAGCIFCVAFFAAGMTQTLFAHQIGVSVYMQMTCLLLGLCARYDEASSEAI